MQTNFDNTQCLKSMPMLQGTLLNDNDDGHDLDTILVSIVSDEACRYLLSNDKNKRRFYELGIDSILLNRYSLGVLDTSIVHHLMKHPKLSLNRSRLVGIGIFNVINTEINNEIFIPFPDEHGHLMSFMSEWCHHSGDSQSHFTLKCNEHACGFFNQEVLKRHTEVVLCSHPVDVLFLKANGIHSGISTMGLYCLNEHQLRLLEHSQVETVVLALENSPAANSFAVELASLLQSRNIACKRMIFSDNNSLRDELLGYETAFVNSPRTSHLYQLYVHAVRCNDVEHSIDIERFCKWKFDLETLSGITNFFLEGHAVFQKRTPVWDFERRLFYFRRWLVNNLESPDDIDHVTLSRFQSHLMHDTQDNHGRVLAESTQLERFKAAKIMLEALEAHGLVCLSDPTKSVTWN